MSGGQPAALMAGCATRLPGAPSCRHAGGQAPGSAVGSACRSRQGLHSMQQLATLLTSPCPWLRTPAPPQPPPSPAHLLPHERRLRVAAAPGPRPKDPRRGLQGAGQRRNNDCVRTEGGPQGPNVRPQRPRLWEGSQGGSAAEGSQGLGSQRQGREVCWRPAACDCAAGSGRRPTCRQPKSVRCASRYSKLLRQHRHLQCESDGSRHARPCGHPPAPLPHAGRQRLLGGGLWPWPRSCTWSTALAGAPTDAAAPSVGPRLSLTCTPLGWRGRPRCGSPPHAG